MCVCVCTRARACVCVCLYFQIFASKCLLYFYLIFIFKTFVLEIEFHHIPLPFFQPFPATLPQILPMTRPPPCTLKLIASLSLIIPVTYSYCLSYLFATLAGERLI